MPDNQGIGYIYNTGLILGLHPANERRRYKVTPSLIGWEQTENQPCNISVQSIQDIGYKA